MFTLPDSPSSVLLPPGLKPGQCFALGCKQNRVGWCREKNLAYCLHWREAHDFCETCGQTWSTHLRCAGCSILVGQNHLTGGVGPGGRCGSCLEGMSSSQVIVKEEANNPTSRALRIEEMKERIQKLWAEGKSRKEIAKEMGLSVRAVFKHTKDL